MPKARRGLAPVLALFMLIGLAPGLNAQIEGDTWTSPTYGFTLSWAGTDWQPEPDGELVAVGPERLDRLHLVNGSSSLYFEGATRYEGRLTSCVAEEANLISQESGVTDVLPYRDDDGSELVADGPNASAAAFTLTLSVGDTKVQLVDYVECRTLTPGEAVLIITLVTEPDIFKSELQSVQQVTDTIVLGEALPLDPLAAYGGWIAAAQTRPSIAGPLETAVNFGPGELGLAAAGVDVADFYARAEFSNPTPPGNSWDIGVGFRDKSNDEQYRLIVDSEGTWYFKSGLGPVIASGSVVDFNRSNGGSNIIEIVAVGDTGYFAFNERLVDTLDLSARSDAGDVFAGTGFFGEDAAAAGSIKVSQFQVWSLEGVDASTALAPITEMSQETFARFAQDATQTPALVGPADGQLNEAIGAAVIEPAGVDLEEFVAEATFVVPSDAADRPWDFGMAFRAQEGGDHYRLTVSSDGTWEFQIGLQAPLTGGRVPSLSFETGATNTLELVVGPDAGAFAVNGNYVSDIDVSDLRGGSDVWIGSGFHRAGAEEGRVTQFRGYTVWALPAESSPDVQAQATPIAATAVSGEPVALRLNERVDSGLDAFAVLTPGGEQTTVTVTAIEPSQDEVLVIHEGTCAEDATLPAFLLKDFDANGRSETTISAPVSDLVDGKHSIAIHHTADDYSNIIACGDIPRAS
ncbi:MAG: hypothetical protein U0031_21750 [Thermomicrobiales bacterium]